MCGGEVRQLKNELGEYIGPYRVWAKNGDYPGLAMSRSIGDLKGKNIGIIPDPGICTGLPQQPRRSAERQ